MTQANPEDMALMLNMGWSLNEIAGHVGIPVRTVERLIVAQVHRERITAYHYRTANENS